MLVFLSNLQFTIIKLNISEEASLGPVSEEKGAFSSYKSGVGRGR